MSTKQLSKAHAALRAEAVREIARAVRLLDSDRTAAFSRAARNHPRAALLAIRRAEARLERARVALEKWAGKP